MGICGFKGRNSITLSHTDDVDDIQIPPPPNLDRDIRDSPPQPESKLKDATTTDPTDPGGSGNEDAGRSTSAESSSNISGSSALTVGN
jgi:hypothetical protein